MIDTLATVAVDPIKCKQRTERQRVGGGFREIPAIHIGLVRLLSDWGTVQDAHDLRCRKKVGLVNAGSPLSHYSWASLLLASVSAWSPPLHATRRELGVFLDRETRLAERRLKGVGRIIFFIHTKEGSHGKLFHFFFFPMRRERVIYNGHGEHSYENTTWPVTLRYPTSLHISVWPVLC